MISLKPVVVSFIADTDTPVSVFLKLRNYYPLPFLFESVESGNRIGRYSFIGLNPIFKFRITGDRSVLEPLQPWFRFSFRSGTAVDHLKELHNAFSTSPVEGLPSFTSGLVGYFSYESIRLTEPALAFNNPADYPADLVSLYGFDSLIIFDNASRKVFLVGNTWSSDTLAVPDDYRSEGSVRARLTMIRNLIIDLRESFPPKTQPSEPSFNVPASVFTEGVTRTQHHITEGDVFQLVLSRRLHSHFTGDSFELFRALRVINPSPYLFYLDMGNDLSVIGSSPEVMVRMKNQQVEVRPIAGTRRRGLTEAEDLAIETELKTDEKELAEHLMLIDLGRNDVGRVSEPGTVEVYDQMMIERYSHVMHIVSGVRGKLKPGLTAVDAFFSCFPAGTLTGAPKIKAIQIIEKLEPVRRGIYGGAIGYIDFNGGMDTCIAIRTLVRHKDDLFLQAGAGIVADSKPDREFQETTEKLNAVLTSLGIVKELLP